LPRDQRPRHGTWPDLSEIGTKLGKDALLEAILEPSAGISFGFEAFDFALKDGDDAYGLIAARRQRKSWSRPPAAS